MYNFTDFENMIIQKTELPMCVYPINTRRQIAFLNITNMKTIKQFKLIEKIFISN